MTTTRLLVLGVVAQHGPTHGYAVRDELVSWGADSWAKVRWGSIYHALRQLTKDGLLAATPATDHPERVDYTITAAGIDAFAQLVRDALADADALGDRLSAGVAFMATLPRAEVIELLLRRLAQFQAHRDAIEPAVRDPGEWPVPGTEHVPELFSLWLGNAEHAMRWTSGLVERLRSGAYTFADEHGA